MPKDEAIGLQGAQNVHQRHAGIVSAATTDTWHDQWAHHSVRSAKNAGLVAALG
jgi:hypothetical protein